MYLADRRMYTALKIDDAVGAVRAPGSGIWAPWRLAADGNLELLGTGLSRCAFLCAGQASLGRALGLLAYLDLLRCSIASCPIPCQCRKI